MTQSRASYPKAPGIGASSKGQSVPQNFWGQKATILVLLTIYIKIFYFSDYPVTSRRR